MKKCSTSLSVKEMQIQHHQDSTSPQPAWLSSREQSTRYAGEDAGKEPRAVLVGM
jgi:hypothetical protein